MFLNDCSGELNAQAVCGSLNGQPTSPVIQVTTATPEGSVIGLAVGLHLAWDSSGATMYVFNGTVGENTGWVALN